MGGGDMTRWFLGVKKFAQLRPVSGKRHMLRRLTAGKNGEAEVSEQIGLAFMMRPVVALAGVSWLRRRVEQKAGNGRECGCAGFVACVRKVLDQLGWPQSRWLRPKALANRMDTKHCARRLLKGRER